MATRYLRFFKAELLIRPNHARFFWLAMVVGQGSLAKSELIVAED